MNTEKQKILEKIQKLLNMAEHKASNENEAAQAAKMAESLMRKHNLSIGDITIEEARKDVVESALTNLKWTAGKAPVWVNAIGIAIADLYETHIMFTPARHNDAHVKKQQCNLSYIGSELDVTVSKVMFEYLYKTINRLTDEWHTSTKVKPGKTRTVKNSYRYGMATSISKRLRAMIVEKEAEYKTAGTSLMVVKKNAISDYLGGDASYDKNTRQETYDSSYSEGYAKGQVVSLNQQMTGTKTTSKRLH